MLFIVVSLVILLALMACVIAAYAAFSLTKKGNVQTLQFGSKIVKISERTYIHLQKNTSRVNISAGAAIIVLYSLVIALFYSILLKTELSIAYTLIGSVFLPVIICMAVFMGSIWFGNKNPYKAWQTGGFVLFTMYIILFPVTQLILWFRTKIAGARKVHPAIFNIKTLMNTGHNSADDIDDLNLPPADQEIYQNAMDFPSLRIRDCMTPRTDIVAIEINDDVELVKQQFVHSGHSKLVVYKENIDNVIGYIHLIDMYRKPQEIKKIIMPITMATESMPASELLRQLIERRRSMAVVIDEFGGTAGMVTIEDLIEEIIGEIDDEFDVDDETEKVISATEYIFSGRLEIDYLNETYNLNLPEGDYDTLGGLISYTYQNIPKPGDEILLLPFRFKIISTDNTKIIDVNVKILPITQKED